MSEYTNFEDTSLRSCLSPLLVVEEGGAGNVAFLGRNEPTRDGVWQQLKLKMEPTGRKLNKSSTSRPKKKRQSSAHPSRKRRDTRRDKSQLSQQSDKERSDPVQLNDDLFVLYEPNSPDLDIFFFHGLHGPQNSGHYLSTWRAQEPDVLWPQLWLPVSYHQARIICVKYDACIEETATEGKMDLHLIAESLMQNIVGIRMVQGSVRPVVLVGHGFGGLVIKQLCLHASVKNGNDAVGGGGDMIRFLDSIRGIFFYDTPHRGIDEKTDLAGKEGPLLRFLIPSLNTDAIRLDDEFGRLQTKGNFLWLIHAVGGSIAAEKTTILNPWVVEGSSRYGDEYNVLHSDHINICRPADTKDSKYHCFTLLIDRVYTKIEVEGRRQVLKVPKTIVGTAPLVTEVVEEHLPRNAFLALVGMMGSGKTTLAKVLFNKLLPTYEYSCFVEGLKTEDKTREQLKKEIWGKMHHHGRLLKKASGSGGDEWRQVVDRRLLLVFDGIAKVEEVNLMQDIAQTVGDNASRYIVTTRDSALVRTLEAFEFRVPMLNDEDAKELLITHAFKSQGEPQEQYQQIVGEIVRACDGLPRTLVDVGKFLRGLKDISVWKSVPEALIYFERMNFFQIVWDELRSSYDGLEEDEKNMFLDVATFFIYSDCKFTEEEVKRAWSSMYPCVPIKLLKFKDRSLIQHVQHTQSTKFHMHEHFRRMGERIATDLGRICKQQRHIQGFAGRDCYPVDYEAIYEGELQLERVVAHKVKIIPEHARRYFQGDPCLLCVMRKVFGKFKEIRYLELDVQFSESCNQCGTDGQLSLPKTLLMLALLGFHERLTFAQERVVVMKRYP